MSDLVPTYHNVCGKRTIHQRCQCHICRRAIIEKLPEAVEALFNRKDRP